MPFVGAVAIHSPGDGLLTNFISAIAAAPPSKIRVALGCDGDLRAIRNSAGFGVSVAATGEGAVLCISSISFQ